MTTGDTMVADDAPDDSCDDAEGCPSPATEAGFALFENPRSESITYHVSNHWREVRVTRFGNETAETQNLLLTCERCEVQYWLEDVPAERVPGTRKYEKLRS